MVVKGATFLYGGARSYIHKIIECGQLKSSLSGINHQGVGWMDDRVRDQGDHAGRGKDPAASTPPSVRGEERREGGGSWPVGTVGELEAGAEFRRQS